MGTLNHHLAMRKTLKSIGGWHNSSPITIVIVHPSGIQWLLDPHGRHLVVSDLQSHHVAAEDGWSTSGRQHSATQALAVTAGQILRCLQCGTPGTL